MSPGLVTVMACHKCDGLIEATPLPTQPPSFCRHRRISEMVTRPFHGVKHSGGSSIRSPEAHITVEVFYQRPLIHHSRPANHTPCHTHHPGPRSVRLPSQCHLLSSAPRVELILTFSCFKSMLSAQHGLTRFRRHPIVFKLRLYYMCVAVITCLSPVRLRRLEGKVMLFLLLPSHSEHSASRY